MLTAERQHFASSFYLSIYWGARRVPFGVDNTAFQRSHERGGSRAKRLHVQIRRIFFEQIKHGSIVEMYWLSTDDNLLADLLSRKRLESFWHYLSISCFLDDGFTLQCMPGSGHAKQLGVGYSSNTLRDGPSHRISSSVPYARSSLYSGLPGELEHVLDTVMDNRLAESSTKAMATALRIWMLVCSVYSFDIIIPTDDPCRGGKVVSYVLHMVFNMDVVWATIENYVWAWRQWMVLQREADPVLGIMNYDVFIAAVRVLTVCAGEPRRAVPLELLRAALRAVDVTDFEEAQCALLTVVLFFTFSRTECPCPKTLDGFDGEHHWQKRDFRLVLQCAIMCLMVRYKIIKQDQRMERPSARPTHDAPGESSDWACIGDVDDEDFSIVRWITIVMSFGVEREDTDPMFLHPDRKRPLTYSKYMGQFKAFLGKVSDDIDYGPHGLRVKANGLSQEAVGSDLTQAHAGWLSVAGMSRYSRFAMEKVVAIPSAMLGLAVPGPPAPRVVQHVRGPRRVSLDVDGLGLEPALSEPVSALPGAPPSDGPSASDQAVREVPGVHLPPGYVRETRTPSAARSATSRDYVVILAPDGHACASRPDAWRYYLSMSEPESVAQPPIAPGPRRASPVRRRTPSSSTRPLRLPDDFVVVESPTCGAASSSAAGVTAPRAAPVVRSMRLGTAADAQVLIKAAYDRRKQLRAGKKGSRELGRLVG